MSKEEAETLIPTVIHDDNTGKSYIKGRFFGKGGFAKCYELKDVKTQKIYAGKIVPRTSLVKTSQREKMSQEIEIHRSLDHPNVVGFYGYFNDTYNIYIILELCRKRSMMELHKRRKALTEWETRYFMKQILDGVNYLHNKKIIHRDLKLGNLFLNDDLIVKIGDFGLATQVSHDGERKKTLCGTPNYIAPEILMKVGHSFEVDVWSIGCILYTLLVGRPPFETSSLRETYARIKTVNYKTPTQLSSDAVVMITESLQALPSKRPSVAKLLKYPFLTSGYLPKSLPLSCLTTAPRMDTLQNFNRKPLIELQTGKLIPAPTSPASKAPKESEIMVYHTSEKDVKKMLITLYEQITQVLKSRPGRIKSTTSEDDFVENTDPSAQPLVWISKWVDYSDKYGFGYQLCDDSVGVMFNDGTRLIMFANKHNVHYISRDLTETYYTVNDYPSTLEKKMKLMNFFLQYMNEHLMKAGGSVAVKNTDSMSRIPYVHQWFRTQTAVVMQLNNGSVQINFLDHTKIIMCPLMAAVTYIDVERNFLTYKFESIQQNGCPFGLEKNLEYAHEKMKLMIQDSEPDE
ncbi:serine/threonine-protein kinase polo [Chelonus insularis]|uniref:serine/threonine-protein kinase polo n=1 Tax=Chelonus insularis TaxID=460826 RepID=UPI00158BFEEA|nr:serine/threonine-protein kinase polo [Chelonus insularis]XP_034938555.1 serine/threonine-protein kinase polo [Chelonus insularis]